MDKSGWGGLFGSMPSRDVTGPTPLREYLRQGDTLERRRRGWTAFRGENACQPTMTTFFTPTESLFSSISGELIPRPEQNANDEGHT